MCSYSGTSARAREFALQHVLQVGGVLLTTYDMVRCNSKALRGDFTGRDGYGDTSDDIVTWDYIILDEVSFNTFSKWKRIEVLLPVISYVKMRTLSCCMRL